jgi:sec-independent protein translocase protein TatB
MNILGMGPTEILLIVVLALIVFGPAKLPQIMGQVGKAIADFRRATSELSDEFNRTIQAELQETRSVVDDTRNAVTGVQTSINSALTGATASLQNPAPANGLPAPAPVAAQTANNGVNGTNGTSSANGSAGAESTAPLADTAQWSWETAAPAPARPPVQIAPGTTDATSAGSADAVAADATRRPASGSESAVTPQTTPQTPPPTRKSKLRDDLLPPY